MKGDLLVGPSCILRISRCSRLMARWRWGTEQGKLVMWCYLESSCLVKWVMLIS